MNKNDDYKIFLDNVDTPVLVAEAEISKDAISDFVVLFVNKKYKESTFNFVTAGQKYSEFKSTLPQGIEWFDIALKVLKYGVTEEREYLATRTHTWYHMTMQRVNTKYCVVTLQNITISKIKDSTLDLIEKTDLLTGLPNRSSFYKTLQSLIEDAGKNKTQLGIAILDLDDMKSVNDVAGHSMGDQVIKKGASILLGEENNNIHSFRLGDDEYVTIVSPIESKEKFTLFLKEIFFKFQNHHITVSIGAVIYPDNGKELSSLIRYADLAMHTVKHNGKNSIKFFDKTMYDNFLEKTKIKQKIDDAIEHQKFELYFQPQYEIDSNKLRGFEALIRWKDDEYGWIQPSFFIPIAEESRSIIHLGRWVLKKSLDTLVEWQKKFNFDGIIAVNVSPAQLNDIKFFTELQAQIESHKINPHKLELEITEGLLITNTEKTINLLKRIRDLGVQISLDDFGTGYASLSYLQMLPINTLKVDKSFIDKINSDDDFSISIIKTIVENVTKKGMITIAEGVETDGQLSCLKHMHCRCMQGFLWGKPMPKEKCDEVLGGDESAIDKL